MLKFVFSSLDIFHNYDWQNYDGQRRVELGTNEDVFSNICSGPSVECLHGLLTY